jgi:hypothetical protein
MGVFMDPVIDELVRAWEQGIWTYDRATKTSFKMHVRYHYSLHDFLAYCLLCTWCVHGKFPYPICKDGVRFIWLQKGVPALPWHSAKRGTRQRFFLKKFGLAECQG